MMAEEIKKTTTPAPEAPCATEEVAVSDVPVAEKPTSSDVDKEAPPQPAPEEVVEGDKKEKDEEKKISESASFKEESNKVDDLIDPEKKALDEFKQLIQEALNKHEFTAPPPPPPVPAKEEEGEKKEEEKKEEDPKTTEEKTETCETPAAQVPEKVEGIQEPAEEIKETIVLETCEGEDLAPPPEEISIWGVPLLVDERSDAVLLKFLRAREFKVKEALTMLKSVVAWRKEFKIDELVEEDEEVGGLGKVVYIHGVDKEGHSVCYNAFGEFQDKELYTKTFSDADKRAKFLRWYIQFLEKNIRSHLDFTPEGTCTIVQVTDLKNSPGLLLFKKELRQSTNQALQLLQDNYPEFVAKQVFINVPWWYVTYNRMISPFLTQRTKSKFVFAGPTKTAETLFKYIAPEQVPAQYGGLSKEDEEEFATADAATEETIKPACKHTIELPITEGGTTLVWEVRVVGWDVSYGAEFVPSAEGGYTWIVQKSRKIGAADEQSLSCSFKSGETGKLVLTFDNQTSKKKKLVYRTKTIKPSE
ncbi:hypothetical protein ACP275_14G334000 [Erythranthe tilingii]